MEGTFDGTGILDKIISGEYSAIGILVILYLFTLIFESKSPGIVSRINPINWIIALLEAFGIKKKKFNFMSQMDKDLYYRHMKSKKASIKNIKTGDLGKDEILKTLINDITDSFDKNFKEVFEDDKLFKNVNNNSEIVDIFTILTQSFINDYRQAWENDAVPAEVISKFGAWHEVVEKIFINHLKDIGVMMPTKDFRDTIITCLQFIISMISVTIEESGDIMHNMNGSLNGLKFKDITIGEFDSYGLPKQQAKLRRS